MTAAMRPAGARPSSQTTLVLIAASPLLLVFSPILIALGPLFILLFFVLALAQIFVPHRLPHRLAESVVATTAASLLSSWLRILRRRLSFSLSGSPAAATRALVNHRVSEAVPPAPMPEHVRKATEQIDGGHGSLESRVQLLADVEAAGQHELLKASLRSLIAEDAAVTLSNPAVKQWLGRRWRNLFIQYASLDEEAVQAASRTELFGLRADSRPEQQRIAERFLRGRGPAEWMDAIPGQSSLPPAPVLEECDLSTEPLLLWCPGLINGMLPVRGFHPSLADLEKATGIRVLRAGLHPLRGCAANVEDLRLALEQGVGLNADLTSAEPRAPPPTSMIVICYSKGMPDFLEFLLEHPEWQSKVKCIFSWAGAIGGSQLADNVWSSIGDWDLSTVMRRLSEVLDWLCPIINLKQGPLERVDEMKLQDAVLELSVAHRGKWLREHAREIAAMNVPVFCITGSTTLQDVAYFNASGWVLLNMYDGNNDMQLTQEGSKLEAPTAAHLAQLNANHWDMTYGPFPAAMTLGSRKLVHRFPKPAALRAMVGLVHELGFL